MGYIFKIGQLEGSFAGWLALSTSWSAVCCCDLRLSDEIRTTGGEKYWDLASVCEGQNSFFLSLFKNRTPALMNS